jgi:phosphopantothenoylcysteine synthetase/decarboxylase
MIMHYFGGGVGHLKNTPPQQAHRSYPVDPDSEEVEVVGDQGDTGGNTRGDPRDIAMSNGELEVGEDDKEKGQDDNEDDEDESNDEDEEDEDEESACDGDEDEDEDYGYGSL